MKFTDPSIGLEFDAFSKHFEEYRKQDASTANIEKTAAFLCEWSKNLLNKTFGRTTLWELDQIKALFRETAELLLEQEKSVSNLDTWVPIKRYALQIQQRARQLSP